MRCRGREDTRLELIILPDELYVDRVVCWLVWFVHTRGCTLPEISSANA